MPFAESFMFFPPWTEFSPYRDSGLVRLTLPSLDPSYPGENLAEGGGMGIGSGMGGLANVSIGNLRWPGGGNQSTAGASAPPGGLQALDREVQLRLRILESLTRRHFRFESVATIPCSAGVSTSASSSGAVTAQLLQQDATKGATRKMARAIIFSRKQ